MKLLLHPTTKKAVQAISAHTHAILLRGDEGSGTTALARHIAKRDTSSFVEPIGAKGEPDHEAGIIRIPQVRALYQILAGKSVKRRVVIIDDAHLMNHSAQNALLKLLEEPPEHTVFILTANIRVPLLPTIMSRVQTVDVLPITHDQSEALLLREGIKDRRTVDQLLFIAGGRPAMLTQLARDDESRETHLRIAADAKQFIQGTKYEKLLIAQKYSAERSSALKLVVMAITILKRTLRADRPQLAASLDALAAIHEAITANGNVRTQLLTFVV